MPLAFKMLFIKKTPAASPSSVFRQLCSAVQNKEVERPRAGVMFRPRPFPQDLQVKIRIVPEDREDIMFCT